MSTVKSNLKILIWYLLKYNKLLLADTGMRDFLMPQTLNFPPLITESRL